MKYVHRKLRNALWKAIRLAPLSKRLALRSLMMRSGLSDAEIEWKKLDSLGPNTGTAIDIGANRGLYTYKLAKLYGRVVAIEPNIDVTEELVAAHLPNVRVIHSGLSSEASRKTLFLPVGPNGETLDGWASFEPNNLTTAEAGIEVKVECITLDSLRLQEVSFIKMDVEGHEVDVLRGAGELFSKWKPTLLAEIKPANLDVIRKLLAEFGDYVESHIGPEPSEMALWRIASTN